MWRDGWRAAICSSVINRRILLFVHHQLAAQHCFIPSNFDHLLNTGSSAPSPDSSNLSDTVHDLHSLEELRLTGCAQVGGGCGRPAGLAWQTARRRRVLRRSAKVC